MIIAMKSKKPNNQINFNQEFRRLGVFIEHVDSNVGLIAEQHSDIKKDIGGIKKTLDSHTEMIGGLAVRMTSATGSSRMGSGPVGVRELTTTKFVVLGDGQVRD